MESAGIYWTTTYSLLDFNTAELVLGEIADSARFFSRHYIVEQQKSRLGILKAVLSISFLNSVRGFPDFSVYRLLIRERKPFSIKTNFQLRVVFEI